ncbi:arginine repressor [Sporohalobacter salinus]|uniref:arginine repressor n=1 Tax=Sporohalobacter salinus TaxID=1494606 RepID=UPI00195F6B63|nr:arginine repressor [Sporohalobacter salinus]MBM7622680.1 transcriptional regulator of arginine metabolism [Sporohalobacter salinus]
MNERQSEILNIIRNETVNTQRELVEKLHKRGIRATQSTVSRDIKRLSLVKIIDQNGEYRYTIPESDSGQEKKGWMKKVIDDFALEVNISNNLIIIDSLPGSADTLGAAIDQVDFSEVIGTVAGDDTLLLVIKPPEKAKKLYNEFKMMIEKNY